MYQKIKLPVVISLIVLLYSCSATKMNIPAKFSAVSTRMPVKGINGWKLKQKLSFGNFQTSVIKRGWTRSTSTTLNSGYSELLNIGMKRSVDDEKGKYSFNLNNGDKVAEIFCQTTLSSEQTDFIIKKWGTTISDIERVDYGFSATIIPLTLQSNEPWQILLTKSYDASKDTSRKKIFSMPSTVEEGIATNGKEVITIKPIQVNKVANKKGKETKLPFKMRSGYELSIDNGVICIINSYDNDLWIYNELDEDTRFIVASIATALMLGPIDNLN